MNRLEFRDTKNSIVNTEQQRLLSRRICDISLEGTHLETLIGGLYEEMGRAGLSFRPKTYLSDEWGCPDRVPVIGIPFYLANPELSKLEGQMTGVEAEDDEEVMRCLRHEAGHAFNYAYRLYARPHWRRVFGRFCQAYDEDYRPIPFSAKFVRNIPGWLAQKHPDEDFAETFAVWLTPDSDWERTYAGTPAMAKLNYVDRIVRRFAQKAPIVNDGRLDTPIQELTMTLESWYEASVGVERISLNIDHTLANDLRRLFPAVRGLPAVDVLRANRKLLIREMDRWTGINRELLETLVDELGELIQSLGLKVEPEQSGTQMVAISVLVTTLVMNYAYTSKFIDT